MWRWWRRTSPKEHPIKDAERDYNVFKVRAEAEQKLEEARRAVAESRRWNKTLEEIRKNNHFRELFTDNLGG